MPYLFLSIKVHDILLIMYICQILLKEVKIHFFLPFKDRFTQEEDSRDLSIKLIHFEKKYKKVHNFTLMQTFNLTILSNDELDKFVSKISKLKTILFPHVKKVLKQMDENYPFVMLNWLLLGITIPEAILIAIIVNLIWYFKYCKATGKVRHFLAQLRGNNKTPPSATSQLHTLNR